MLGADTDGTNTSVIGSCDVKSPRFFYGIYRVYHNDGSRGWREVAEPNGRSSKYRKTKSSRKRGSKMQQKSGHMIATMISSVLPRGIIRFHGGFQCNFSTDYHSYYVASF